MKHYEKILPIVLRYEEKGWTKQTENCLEAAGFKEWDYADREGVGSMVRAFNYAMESVFTWSEKIKYDFIWFVTNVSFPPEMPKSLMDCFDEKTAAVHPAMNSDHPHIKNANGVNEGVPFIEWTAPMVRLSALDEIGLCDEDMPYLYFDLDWSYRARQAGWTLKVDGRHRLDHTYLWRRMNNNPNGQELITRIRHELRAWRDPASRAAMERKYGKNWKQILCPCGTC